MAARRRWVDAAALGVAGGLQALVSMAAGSLTAAALVCAAPTLAWATGQWRSGRYWTRVSAAALLSVLLAGPVAGGLGVERPATVAFAATGIAAPLAGFARVPAANLVYGHTGLMPHTASPAGESGDPMFPGLVLLGLAACGAWVAWRSDAAPAARLGAALVLGGVGLSMLAGAPDAVDRLGAGHVLLRLAGPPARFGVIAVLGLIVLAALGMRHLVRTTRPAVGAVLIALLCVEYVNVPTAGASAAAPAADRGQSAAPERAFRAGEVATYAVRWMGDLPAGEIVLRVDEPAPDERTRWPDAAWRFEASVSTAEWVSAFYEARGRFTTLATSGLLPVFHTRDLQEGSRRRPHVDVFDRAAGRVVSGPAEAAVLAGEGDVGALVPSARDALTALYQLRAQPLGDGSVTELAVNDAGQPMSVHAHAEGREVVALASGEVPAQRIQLRVERPPDAPLEATLWLTQDARRSPVRVDVVTGFGRFRVERVDYRP
ncbi:MAG: DUF3108 domain-containing protein [Vicinamibacterales bacterium]